MLNLFYLSKLVSEHQYPLVYIPEDLLTSTRLKRILTPSEMDVREEYKLKKPEFPRIPHEPALKNADGRMVKYQKGLKLKIALTFIATLLFGTILPLLYGHINNTKIDGFYITVALIASVAIPYSIVKEIPWQTKFVPFSDEEKQKIISYNEKVVSEYEKSKSEYPKLKKKYDREIKKYNSKIEEIIPEFTLKKYSEELKTSNFSFPTSAVYNIPPKGRTENYFFGFLRRHFSEEIMQDMMISFYYPDFVYKSRKYNFHIDIEIDEQYDYKTKNPIHYIGVDDDRNNTILAYGWIIIRFTESQIFGNPNGCCQYIEDIIKRIEMPHAYSYPIPTIIEREKRWTYEEALLAAENNTRD